MEDLREDLTEDISNIEDPGGKIPVAAADVAAADGADDALLAWWKSPRISKAR